MKGFYDKMYEQSTHVVLLKESDMNSVLRLYIKCYKDNPYCVKLFPNAKTRPEKMKNQLAPIIEYCIKGHTSIGVRRNGRLVAFLLCFNYCGLKFDNPNLFIHVFDGEKEKNSIKFPLNEMHEKINKLHGETMFLVAMGVDQKYRRKKYASCMLDATVKSWETHNLFGDIPTQEAFLLCDYMGYAIDSIADGYCSFTRYAHGNNS